MYYIFDEEVIKFRIIQNYNKNSPVAKNFCDLRTEFNSDYSSLENLQQVPLKLFQQNAFKRELFNPCIKCTRQLLFKFTYRVHN